MSRLVDPREPAAIAAIAEIVRGARVRNATLGITGVLVFDGERFCQYLEGRADEVASVYRAIEADRRHEKLELLASGTIELPRFEGWSMAYAFPARRTLFDTIRSVPRADVVALIEKALPECDVEV